MELLCRAATLSERGGGRPAAKGAERARSFVCSSSKSSFPPEVLDSLPMSEEHPESSPSLVEGRSLERISVCASGVRDCAARMRALSSEVGVNGKGDLRTSVNGSGTRLSASFLVLAPRDLR